MSLFEFSGSLPDVFITFYKGFVYCKCVIGMRRITVLVYNVRPIVFSVALTCATYASN
jgi:hypothetical protein